MGEDKMPAQNSIGRPRNHSQNTKGTHHVIMGAKQNYSSHHTGKTLK